MRRAGLLIAGVFLATGAGLALSAPASAATNGHRSDCDDSHGSYHHHYHHRGHHHHGGGISIGIGIGIGIGG